MKAARCEQSIDFIQMCRMNCHNGKIILNGVFCYFLQKINKCGLGPISAQWFLKTISKNKFIHHLVFLYRK